VVRGVARTAVIAGTATATSYAVGSRIEKRREDKYQQEQAELAQQQYQYEQPQYQQPAYQPPQYASAEPEQTDVQADTDVTSKLQQLVELKQNGMLTDEEFSAAKARLLGA
jgi:hypothetical protein